MFQLSNQYNELLSFYKQMAENAHITVRPPSWWLGQIECISSLHPEIYWALFTSEGYNNAKFYGVHRMKDRLDSKNYYQ